MAVDISRFMSDGIGVKEKSFIDRILYNPSEPITPALDLNRSVLIDSGGTGSRGGGFFVSGHAYLKSDGTGVVKNNMSGATIIEFSPGIIKSIQRGRTPHVRPTATITINSVDINKSFVIVNHYGAEEEGSGGFAGKTLGYLSDSTTLKLYLDIRSSSVDIAYQVVEFY